VKIRKNADFSIKLPRFRCSAIALAVCYACFPASLNAEYEISVFGDLRYSDNGNRAADGSTVDAISEVISEIGINLSAEKPNGMYQYELEYEFAHTAFMEETQDDRSVATGESRLSFGTPATMLGLDLKHSRQLTTINPLLQSDLNNSEERDIASVIPQLRWRMTPTDNVIISGNYTQTTYNSPNRDTGLGQIQGRSDSTQIGQRFAWTRRLSSISNFGLDAGRSETEIDGLEEKFEYEEAMLSYASVLRQLNYKIAVGYNQSTFTGEPLKAPRYDIDFEYERGRHIFGLNFVGRITETSQGNGNQERLSEQGGIDSPLGRDNTLGLEPDSYESQVSELSYSVQAMPNFLRLDFLLGAEQSRYQNNIEEDADSSYFNLTANFLLNSRSDVIYEYAWWSLERLLGEANKTKNNSHRITYIYNFSERLSANAYFTRDTWDTDSANGGAVFTEHVLGVSGQYRLF